MESALNKTFRCFSADFFMDFYGFGFIKHKLILPLKLPILEDSVSRCFEDFRYVRQSLEVREITRFPWACGELPQALPSGISPIMYIPQESRNFPDLFMIIGRTKISKNAVQNKYFFIKAEMSPLFIIIFFLG